jgi:hypothetical protein
VAGSDRPAKPMSCATNADERSQHACERIEQYETELVEVCAEQPELEVRKSELEDICL